MSEKEKLPFWLGVVLGMILGMSAVLIVVVPQLDRDQPDHEQIVLPTVDVEQPLLEQAKVAEPLDVSNSTPQQEQEQQPDQIQLDYVGGDEKTESMAEPVVEAKSTKDDLALSAKTDEPLKVVKAQAKAETAVKKSYGISLVLDDVGYDLRAVKRILALSVPVAISVLPESPFAREAATLSNQAGQVVMLHLPMQPGDPSLQMTDDFLHENMKKKDIRDTFLRDLAKVPFVEGVNNHMGSKLTQLDKPMDWVMQVCREKELFFVDSRTSANSVAAKSAKAMGVAWASRSIFLDHEMTLDAMKHAWQRARNCAKKKLSCVVIAHPRAKTVAFLENYLSKEDAKYMVSIKHLLQGEVLNSSISAAALP